MTTDLAQSSSTPMRTVLNVHDFMLLWIGQATSMPGDQFHGIASAWLVLKLTGDPLALGSIPRSIFPVIGGAMLKRNLAALYLGVGTLLLVLGLALLPKRTGGGLREYVADG